MSHRDMHTAQENLRRIIKGKQPAHSANKPTITINGQMVYDLETMGRQSFRFKTDRDLYLSDNILLSNILLSFEEQDKTNLINTLKALAESLSDKKQRYYMVKGSFPKDEDLNYKLLYEALEWSTYRRDSVPRYRYKFSTDIDHYTTEEDRKIQFSGINYMDFINSEDRILKITLQINDLRINIPDEIIRVKGWDEKFSLLAILPNHPQMDKTWLFEAGLTRILYSNNWEDLQGLPVILVNLCKINHTGFYHRGILKIQIISVPPYWIHSEPWDEFPDDTSFLPSIHILILESTTSISDELAILNFFDQGQLNDSNYSPVITFENRSLSFFEYRQSAWKTITNYLSETNDFLLAEHKNIMIFCKDHIQSNHSSFIKKLARNEIFDGNIEPYRQHYEQEFWDRMEEETLNHPNTIEGILLRPRITSAFINHEFTPRRTQGTAPRQHSNIFAQFQHEERLQESEHSQRRQHSIENIEDQNNLIRALEAAQAVQEAQFAQNFEP